MFNITKQANNITAYLTEFIADNETDIQQLPTNIAPGSKCIVIESGNIYYLNCSHQWIKSQINENGGSSGEGSREYWENMSDSNSLI